MRAVLIMHDIISAGTIMSVLAQSEDKYKDMTVGYFDPIDKTLSNALPNKFFPSYLPIIKDGALSDIAFSKLTANDQPTLYIIQTTLCNTETQIAENGGPRQRIAKLIFDKLSENDKNAFLFLIDHDKYDDYFLDICKEKNRARCWQSYAQIDGDRYAESLFGFINGAITYFNSQKAPN